MTLSVLRPKTYGKLKYFSNLEKLTAQILAPKIILSADGRTEGQTDSVFIADCVQLAKISLYVERLSLQDFLDSKQIYL